MTSRSSLIDAGQVKSERVTRFHDYWRSKCAGGSLPSRTSINPTEIPRLLPYLVMAEIEREPLRVRYRLVGTRVVEANGADYTNRYLDECNFAVEPLLLSCYQQLVEMRAPVFAYYEWNKSDWRDRRGAVGASETGFFPLSSDGTVIDYAINIADSDVRPHRVDPP
ncbi:MAG TPA: PAS domain-containing protein [Dongiaceae bacterium]|nr:PAS domain-containing protein [Dongiaceae bacterium]